MTMPMKPRVDGYGNPLPDEPVWQGYTLDDFVKYVQTGQPVSSVPAGKTGYGLDEVGDANAYHDTKGPGLDWRRVVGGALAGLSGYRADEQTNFGQGLGSGFAGGTAWSDSRDTQARRDALTDSQIRAQQALTDERMMDVIDGPQRREREAAALTAQQDYNAQRARELDVQVGNLLANRSRDDALLPSRIAENEAQARAANALAKRRGEQGTGGSGSGNKDAAAYRAFLNQRIRTLQTERSAAQRAYDHDTVEDLDAEIERLTAEQDQLARTMPGGQGITQPPGPRSGAFDGGPLNLPPMPKVDTLPPPPPLRPGSAGETVAKTPVTREEYDAIVADAGADYAAKHFTVSR